MHSGDQEINHGFSHILTIWSKIPTKALQSVCGCMKNLSHQNACARRRFEFWAHICIHFSTSPYQLHLKLREMRASSSRATAAAALCCFSFKWRRGQGQRWPMRALSVLFCAQPPGGARGAMAKNVGDDEGAAVAPPCRQTTHFLGHSRRTHGGGGRSQRRQFILPKLG